jgi:hypothetical protein
MGSFADVFYLYAGVPENLETVGLNFDVTGVAISVKITLPKSVKLFFGKILIQDVGDRPPSPVEIGVAPIHIPARVNDQLRGSALTGLEGHAADAAFVFESPMELSLMLAEELLGPEIEPEGQASVTDLEDVCAKGFVGMFDPIQAHPEPSFLEENGLPDEILDMILPGVITHPDRRVGSFPVEPPARNLADELGNVEHHIGHQVHLNVFPDFIDQAVKPRVEGGLSSLKGQGQILSQGQSVGGPNPFVRSQPFSLCLLQSGIPVMQVNAVRTPQVAG